jgi:hypothetical protein
MDYYQSYKKDRGYNIASVAGSSLGVQYTDVARANISKAKAAPVRGFIDPDGNEVTIQNMREFCAEHGLNLASMYALSAGKQQQHRGWRHITTYKGNGRGKGFKHTWDGFIDPDGNEVGPFRNLMLFCLRHGLDRMCMKRLYYGEGIQHRGWTHRNARQAQPIIHKVYRGFIDPDGHPIGPISDLGAFCRQHGLDHSGMAGLASGRKPSYRGWIYDPDQDEH